MHERTDLLKSINVSSALGTCSENLSLNYWALSLEACLCICMRSTLKPTSEVFNCFVICWTASRAATADAAELRAGSSVALRCLCDGISESLCSQQLQEMWLTACVETSVDESFCRIGLESLVALPSRYKHLKDPTPTLPTCYKHLKDITLTVPFCYKHLKDRTPTLSSCYKHLKDLTPTLPSCYKHSKDLTSTLPSCCKHLKDLTTTLPSCYKHLKDLIPAPSSCCKHFKDLTPTLPSCCKHLKWTHPNSFFLL